MIACFLHVSFMLNVVHKIMLFWVDHQNSPTMLTLKYEIQKEPIVATRGSNQIQKIITCNILAQSPGSL